MDPLHIGEGLSRRELLQRLASLAACFPAVRWSSTPAIGASQTQKQTAAPLVQLSELPPATYLSPGDDTFLEQMENANFQYFWEQCDPKTGIVKDRCNVRGSDTSVLGQHRSNRLRTDRALYRRKTRLHLLLTGPRSSPDGPAFSVEENAQ